MKQYLKTIICLAVALVSLACSSGGDNDLYSFKPESYNDVVSRGNTYEGIWMVNDVKAEAADVSVNVDNNGDQYGGSSGSASFLGFPFQTITDLVMPGATVSSIPNSIAIPMRYVGYSDNAYYLEFTPMYYSSMDPQNIFYKVILEDGKEIGLTLHMVTEKSSVILNSEGGTFSCIIPVDKILCSEGAGVIFKEIPLNPEMQLRYTSINRMKGSTVKSGDRQAMRRLYERYKGYAMSIGLRYIPDSDDVEDVVQDSFVKILTSVQHIDYQGEGSLTAWVRKTVVNKALDFVRRHERISFTGTIPDIPDEEPELERIPPHILSRMIAQLPSGYRLVLNLYVFEHCSHQEIAQRLGIKENSSTSQLARAKQMLIKMMKEYIKRHEI